MLIAAAATAAADATGLLLAAALYALQTPDGVWHVFPISGGWGHCTATDLIHWNCSHPSTGWSMINTGAISVTPAGQAPMRSSPALARWQIPADPTATLSIPVP